MSKKTRGIALAVIVFAGCAGLWYVWTNYGFTPNSADAPTLAKQISGQASYDGTVVPVKNADLGFIIPAKITSLTKKVGDVVKVGEILAVQDSADINAQIRASQASLQSAEADLEVAKHDLKKEQLKVHDVSGNIRKEQKVQVSSNEDSVAVKESDVIVAQNNLAQTEAQLAKTFLKAPFNGIITRLDSEVGEISGAAVPAFLTIASNDSLGAIEIFVSDLDVTNIKSGEVAQVKFDALTEQTAVKAHVYSVEPMASMNNGSSTYKIKLMLEETNEKIKLGMHASVSF